LTFKDTYRRSTESSRM